MKKIILYILFIVLLVLPLNLKAASSSTSSCKDMVTIEKVGEYPSVGSYYTSYTKKPEKECRKFDNKDKSSVSGWTTLLAKIEQCYYCSNTNKCTKTCDCDVSCKIRYSFTACRTKTYDTEYNTLSIEGNQYIAIDEDGNKNDAFCINPGRPFQNNSKYCLADDFDIKECENSNDSDYRCGLAWIMMQNLNEKGEKVNNYSYGAMLTALRMWVAFKSNFSEDDMNNFGMEEESIDYVTTSSFYSVTADKVINNSYSGDLCKKIGNVTGLMCTGNNGIEDYKNSIELFKKALAGQPLSLSGEKEPLVYHEFKPGERVLLTKTVYDIVTRDDIKSIDELEEHFNSLSQEEQDKITNALDLREVTEIVVYYDPSTGEWKNVDVDVDLCKKFYCKFDIKTENLCDVLATISEWKIEVEYKTTTISTKGSVKQYLHGSDQKKYQIMMVLEADPDVNTTEETIVTKIKDVNISVDCPSDYCSLDNSSDTPKEVSCNGDGVNNVTLEQNTSSMSCILNSDPSDNPYRVEENSLCKLYCKDYYEYYLPGKTTVYAGMQFSYDIFTDVIDLLKENKSIEITKPSQGEDERKLSAIVLKKTHCVSDIDINEYNKQYSDEGSDKDKLKEDLADCYMRNDGGSIARALSDHVSDPLDLEVTYGDLEYGKTSKIRLDEGAAYYNEKSKYYCKGDDCYTYNSNETNSGNQSEEEFGTVEFEEGIIYDYATYIGTSVMGYYQAQEYWVNPFTGNVVTGEKEGLVKLAPYVYPVSLNSKLGENDIKFNFDGKLEYTCKYNVYKASDEFENTCFDVVDNVTEVCTDGANKNEAYGFIYRNVDLNNLFPNNLFPDGENIPGNWSEKVINDIQNKAQSIWNDEAEYSFTLDSEDIEKIKAYNRAENKNGGYLNSTLTCKAGDNDSNSNYSECTSWFLDKFLVVEIK